ncbi:MAG: pilus assembly protein [Eubacterium sp.]|nr:pilus assembly protein [Eubacterium sp.]
MNSKERRGDKIDLELYINNENKKRSYLLFKYNSLHTYDRIPSAASLTVEASLVLPIFLFAVLTVAYFGLLAKTQDEVRHAMSKTVSEASAEVGAGLEKPAKSMVYYRAKLALYLGDTSLTTNLLGSSFLEENDEIDLVVTYTAKLPFAIFDFWHPIFRERVHGRAFVGVDTRSIKDENVPDDIIVYITPNGRVYHRDRNCTYLKPRVSQILFGDIARLRNSGGGKYYPCHVCAGGGVLSPDTPVWITGYGDRYHTNRACHEIQHQILEVFLSEVGNRTPCSKCG